MPFIYLTGRYGRHLHHQRDQVDQPRLRRTRDYFLTERSVLKRRYLANQDRVTPVELTDPTTRPPDGLDSITTSCREPRGRNQCGPDLPRGHRT